MMKRKSFTCKFYQYNIRNNTHAAKHNTHQHYHFISVNANVLWNRLWNCLIYFPMYLSVFHVLSLRVIRSWIRISTYRNNAVTDVAANAPIRNKHRNGTPKSRRRYTKMSTSGTAWGMKTAKTAVKKNNTRGRRRIMVHHTIDKYKICYK